jgi:hypothetical protein
METTTPGRRQTEVLRNLDDSLRVLNFLTLRSCGLVVLFYSGCYALDLTLRVWTFLFGLWSFFAQLGATFAVAVVLSWAEKHDDEHLVPSAIRYFVERPWRWVYSGARGDGNPSHRLEGVLRAALLRPREGVLR